MCEGGSSRGAARGGGLFSPIRVLILGLGVCMILLALNALMCMGRRGVRESALQEKIRALEEENGRHEQKLAALQGELDGERRAHNAAKQGEGGHEGAKLAPAEPPAEQQSAEEGAGPAGEAGVPPEELVRAMLQDPAFEGAVPAACEIPEGDKETAVYACNEARRRLRRDRVDRDCAAEQEGVWCLNVSDANLRSIALTPDLTLVGDAASAPWFWATDPNWRQPWRHFGGHVPPDVGMGPELVRFYGRDASVLDFGAGVGQYAWYLKGIVGAGGVRYYEAYDGAGNIEDITHGAVKSLLLTVPQYLRRKFDWVQCLEVGEHIKPETTDIFVDNLVRHAKRGIVLSWGVPRQRGTGHVNLKPNKEVIAIMKEKGFEHNATESQTLRDLAQWSWFKQSVMVFERQGSTT